MAGISQITDDPSSAVSLLATNLPSSSVFFLTLIVTNGLAGAAGGILQIARLAIYYIKAFLLGGSPRALYKVQYTMPAVKFGQLYPAQMLIVGRLNTFHCKTCQSNSYLVFSHRPRILHHRTPSVRFRTCHFHTLVVLLQVPLHLGP